MVRVFTLEDDRRVGTVDQPRGMIDRRWPSDVIAQEFLVRRPKVGIGKCFMHRILETSERLEKDLGDKDAAEAAEVTARVGNRRVSFVDHDTLRAWGFAEGEFEELWVDVRLTRSPNAERTSSSVSRTR
jgi:hypothetical protein